MMTFSITSASKNLENFFVKYKLYPVNLVEEHEFMLSVRFAFLDSIVNAKTELFSSLFALNYFYYNVAQDINFRKFVRVCNEKNIELEKNNSFMDLHYGITIPCLKSRLRSIFSSYLSSLRKLHRKRIYTFPFCSSNLFLNQDTVSHKYFPLPLFISNKTISKSERTNLLEVIESFVNKLQYLCERHEVKLGINYFNQVSKSLQELAETSLILYRTLVLPGKKRNFTIANPGRFLSRLFAAKLIDNEFKVYNYPHGNNVGIQSSFKIGLVDAEICTDLYVPSKHSKYLFKKYFMNQPYAQRRKVNFQIVDFKPEYNFLSKKNTIRADKIKRIMVVEGLVKEGFSDWFYNLSIQLDIGNTLRKTKCHSILQARPDNDLCPNSYSLFNEISQNKFEETILKSDLIIFPYIKTSTFGIGLASQLPIVIFSHHFEDFDELTHEDIRKRCIVIESTYDGQSVSYNEDQLIDVIENIDEVDIDCEPVHKYFFSR